jgi:hypothetical protein
MPLGIEMGVERILLGTRRIVGNDGDRALLGDGSAEVAGIISRIGDDGLGGEALDQSARLGCIASLTGSEDEADWAAQTADGEVDLGCQAAARPSDGLMASPPFAPLEC